jgi:RNA-directed DNA polymerase
MAVKRVLIPKPPKPNSNKFRKLGVPTIYDRCIQEKVRFCLEPYFEAKFSDFSYGFRPNIGIKDLITDLKSWIKTKNKENKQIYYLDVDFSQCFDFISHKVIFKQIPNKSCRYLMKKCNEKCNEKM